tara:strand:+ start:418 stop:732 length:315 start_codon:yes stop_codon:yes gene_type:complete
MAFKMNGPSLYNSPLKQTDSTFADGSKKTARDMFNDEEVADQAPPRKKAKTSFKNKAKAAWYTEMHHDGGKSSTAEKWKTYKGKKKEFRDAKETGKDVSWKSGY